LILRGGAVLHVTLVTRFLCETKLIENVTRVTNVRETLMI